MNQEKQQQKIDYLYKRLLLFWDFWAPKFIGYHHMDKNIEVAVNQVKENIMRAFENKDMKVLKAGSLDIDTQLKEMPFHDAMELGRIFKKELGEDITQLEKKQLDKIARIMKRGKINNPDEYALITDRANDIYADPDKTEELNILNRLLIAFNKRKK